VREAESVELAAHARIVEVVDRRPGSAERDDPPNPANPASICRRVSIGAA
jgi:hypothetical protein